MTTRVTKPPPWMSSLHSPSQRNEKGKGLPKTKTKPRLSSQTRNWLRWKASPWEEKQEPVSIVRGRTPIKFPFSVPEVSKPGAASKSYSKFQLKEQCTRLCRGDHGSLPVCTGMKEAGRRQAGLGGGWGCGSGVCACGAPSSLGWGSQVKGCSSASDPEKAPTLQVELVLLF